MVAAYGWHSLGLIQRPIIFNFNNLHDAKEYTGDVKQKGAALSTLEDRAAI